MLRHATVQWLRHASLLPPLVAEGQNLGPGQRIRQELIQELILELQ